MVKFVQKTIAGLKPEDKAQLPKIIAAVSAEAQLPAQSEADRKDAAAIEEGRKLIDSETFRCTECHQFRKKNEDATAPELTGYGSSEWLKDFIKNPAQDRFYGKRNDHMPIFGEGGRLDEKSLDLLVRWLRSQGAGPHNGLTLR